MQKSKEDIRQAVRDNYGKIAQNSSSCCGPSSCAPSCCTPTTQTSSASLNLGYSQEHLHSVPEGADLGLGCGNPHAFATLKAGETVLDLGSGAGFDCFLAAQTVGDQGKVIGVDMTSEMLEKARNNLAKTNYQNIEFRLGEIEHLPVADNTVDVIISNCVINLSPEKQQVFNEAFRVLKPGGRLAISDIVASVELPAEMKENLALYTGCMAGASSIEELHAMLVTAGFSAIKIAPKDESRSFIREWAPDTRIEDYVLSATISAVKPD